MPQRFICKRALVETVIIRSEGVIILSRWTEGAYYTNFLDARCLHKQRMLEDDAIFRQM